MRVRSRAQCDKNPLSSAYQLEPDGTIPDVLMNGACGQTATRVKP
jgi:hypothetical protein